MPEECILCVLSISVINNENTRQCQTLFWPLVMGRLRTNTLNCLTKAPSNQSYAADTWRVCCIYWEDSSGEVSDHRWGESWLRTAVCSSLYLALTALHVSPEDHNHYWDSHHRQPHLRMSFSCLSSPLRQSPSFTSCMFCSFSCPTSESSWAILSSFLILKQQKVFKSCLSSLYQLKWLLSDIWLTDIQHAYGLLLRIWQHVML